MRIKINRIFINIVIITIIMTTAAAAADVMEYDTPAAYGVTEASSPGVSASSAILIDAGSGRIIYEKNARLRRSMASTTKIMTALLALERGGDLSRTVAVSPSATGVEGSSIYLQANEKLTLEALIYAVMLASANDAAAAIAYEIGGGIEGFAELMNKRAAELNLSDTNFTNPHGLDNPEHYTTAYDLARLAAHALANENFREISSTKKKSIPCGDGVKYLQNHNKLLRLYDGCVGVKTGFTKKSGRCLVSAAERDGLRLVAVTLGAPDDWNDHSLMLDYGFAKYERVTIAGDNGESFELPVIGGTETSVRATNRGGVSASLPRERGEITKTVELPRFLYAPVEPGTEIGSVIYYCGGEEIGRTALITETGSDGIDYTPKIVKWIRGKFIG